MSPLPIDTLVSAIATGLDCSQEEARALLRQWEDRQGGPAARFSFLLDGLEARFPEAHSRWSSAPPEPAYLQAIDALKQQSTFRQALRSTLSLLQNATLPHEQRVNKATDSLAAALRSPPPRK